MCETRPCRDISSSRAARAAKSLRWNMLRPVFDGGEVESLETRVELELDRYWEMTISSSFSLMEVLVVVVVVAVVLAGLDDLA